MQGSSIWTAPTGTLGTLVAEARQRVAELRRRAAELERAAHSAPAVPSFSVALRREDVAVIAEVKRRSPSKGWIKAHLSAVEQAVAYEQGGAAAVSVLTEPAHFGGSVDDLVGVGRRVTIPRLKKDFHIHALQLVEAKALGASAALLIARAVAPDELRDLIQAGGDLGLELLVEVRDERELELVLTLEAAVVGVNNRDLETLAIDTSTGERLLGAIPAHVIAVVESGITKRIDVERAGRAGADAVLVGSAVSAAANPAEMVRTLTGAARAPRGA